MIHSNNTLSSTSFVPTPAALDPNGLLPTEAAYRQVKAEIEAVPVQGLTTVNVDMMAVITTATGAVPRIQAFRPEIEDNWRNFDFEQFDKLEVYLLALSHAHSRHLSASMPKEDLTPLISELTPARDNLLANASSLASLGLLGGEQLKNVKTVLGYRALASDVLTLCSVYRDDWSRVEGKTPYTQAELLRLGTLALHLISALGDREQAAATPAEATLLRQKAFTLFVGAYDTARRAVHYLRAKSGDAEHIAPSLYTSRSGRRRETEEAAPVVNAPAADAAGTEAAPAASGQPRQIVIDNVAGLPVDHPFTN